jgi:hypothetical protein
MWRTASRGVLVAKATSRGSRPAEPSSQTARRVTGQA